MTAIYLLRHGHADLSLIRERNWPGAAGDLAPLSALGVQQALRAADSLWAAGATAIVSSPMTRALQTASLVGSRLGLQVDVQFDLREWLPDDTFSWRTQAEVTAAMRDLERYGGAWPAGTQRHWEPLAAVRARATAALRTSLAALRDDDVLIAACHGVVIWSLTGERHTGTGEWRRIDMTRGGLSGRFR